MRSVHGAAAAVKLAALDVRAMPKYVPLRFTEIDHAALLSRNVSYSVNIFLNVSIYFSV